MARVTGVISLTTLMALPQLAHVGHRSIRGPNWGKSHQSLEKLTQSPAPFVDPVRLELSVVANQFVFDRSSTDLVQLFGLS